MRTKLTVIMHVVVAGSTALVQKDERAAHERIKGTFQRFSETIAAYGGITHELRGMPWSQSSSGRRTPSALLWRFRLQTGNTTKT